MNSTKTYLLKYRRLKQKAERYRERISQIEETLKGVNLDGLPHGSILSDPTKTAAINLMILKEELNYATVEAEKVCQKIAAEIEQMPTPQFCELLYCRYILLLPWEETAARLRNKRPGSDYNIKYVTGEMHKRALKEFEGVIK